MLRRWTRLVPGVALAAASVAILGDGAWRLRGAMLVLFNSTANPPEGVVRLAMRDAAYAIGLGAGAVATMLGVAAGVLLHRAIRAGWRGR